MIWVRGSIVADDALSISVLDRTFEYGLGLFETLRTWNGHATLLPRHLDRLRRSAAELGLPLDPAALPDAEAVAALREADGHPGDAMLRITLSGGLSERHGSVLWMRSAPLPHRVEGGYRLGPHRGTEAGGDLAAYKSLNYWGRRRAYEHARTEGYDEAILVTENGFVREGSRTNLFLVQDGSLSTPAQGRVPILPGILRGVVLERAGRLGLGPREDPLSTTDLDAADEVFLTNSVRGIMPVRSWLSRTYPCPGPITARLWEDVLGWLESGGVDG